MVDDARDLSEEFQAETWRRGLIPGAYPLHVSVVEPAGPTVTWPQVSGVRGATSPSAG